MSLAMEAGAQESRTLFPWGKCADLGGKSQGGTPWTRDGFCPRRSEELLVNQMSTPVCSPSGLMSFVQWADLSQSVKRMPP